MPERHGERENIDVVAGLDVFHHRPVADLLVSDRLPDDLPVGGVEGLAEFELVEVGGKSKRHVLARAAKEIAQDAESLRIVRDVVKQRARGGFAVLQQFGGVADILLPTGAGDAPQFAERVGLLNPFAQIAVGDGMFLDIT